MLKPRHLAITAALLIVGFGSALAFGQGAADTTTVVTVTDPDKIVTIPGAVHALTFTIPTVTVTTTVTGTTSATATPTPAPPTQTPTATPQPPTQTPTPTPGATASCKSAPWPSGSSLPARIAESTGAVINVSTSAALRSALASASPGQMIHLASGHYGAGESAYAIGVSGSAANPITIEGPAVLDTTLKISGSYLRVRDLEIDGTSRSDENGVYGPGGSNVELCGLYIHNITRGGLYAQGIITSSSTSNWQIINARIERIGTQGTSTSQLEHGLYLNGTGYLLANVLVFNTSGFGGQLYPNLDNSILTHLTLVAAGTKSGLISTSGSTGNRVFNSIAYKNASYGFEGTLAGDHLVSFNNVVGQYAVASCAACLTTDPKLDTSFRPQSGSSAIGHSDPHYSPAFDLAGKARPSSPTAGAYEP